MAADAEDDTTVDPNGNQCFFFSRRLEIVEIFETQGGYFSESLRIIATQ